MDRNPENDSLGSAVQISSARGGATASVLPSGLNLAPLNVDRPIRVIPEHELDCAPCSALREIKHFAAAWPGDFFDRQTHWRNLAAMIRLDGATAVIQAIKQASQSRFCQFLHESSPPVFKFQYS